MSAPIQLPPILKFINAFGPVLRPVGLCEIRTDPTWYIDRARKATGLSDFGPYDVETALGHLLHTFRHEADMSLFGRVSANTFIHRNLMNLLKSNKHVEENPAIEKVDVERPLIVLGSPRTGTTLLHQLLAIHPNARSLKLWELHRPCPPPKPEFESSDPRIKRSDREFGMFYRLVPGMRAIHNMEPKGPEECLHLFVNTFSCRTSFALIANFNRYTNWINALDMVPAYQQYKRDLQILNLHYPGRLIVLKSPAHLQCLEALNTVFPKARVVQLHRDPVSAAGSYCSLSEAVQISLRRSSNLSEIGETWNKLWVPAILNASRIRKQTQMDVLDVNYRDLISRPSETVHSIFNHFDLDTPVELDGRVQQYLADNPKGKHGKHVYTLSRYGLDGGELYERFAEYIDEFGVPREDRTR